MDNFCKDRIDSIQVLRGLAAILVVFEHVRFLGFGAYGVDIFFPISGFIMMYTTVDGMKDFLTKRAIRIIPLYWLLTLGVFCGFIIFPQLFQVRVLTVSDLLKNLFFIPSDGYGSEPILPIGWSIEYEVFFYLLFFIAGKICHKYRALISSALIIILVYYNKHFVFSQKYFAANANPIIIEFIYGMLGFYVVRYIYSKRDRIKPIVSWVALAISLGIVIAIPFFLNYEIVTFANRYKNWGICGIIILILFYVAGLNITMPKPFVMLGNMSFSIYLLHYYIVKIFDIKIFNFETINPKSVVGLLITLVIILACSYFSYEIFEKRLSRWLKKVLIPSSKTN